MDEISPAGPADLAAIAEVHIQARDAYYAGFVPQPDLDRRAAELRVIYPQVFARPDSTLLCARSGAGIVGFALLAPPLSVAADPAEVGELSQIHVKPDHWRRGIGSRLHAECVTTWRQAGLRAAMLEVWSRNTRARAFYAHHGWTPTPHTRPARAGTHYLGLRLPL